MVFKSGIQYKWTAGITKRHSHNPHYTYYITTLPQKNGEHPGQGAKPQSAKKAFVISAVKATFYLLNLNRISTRSGISDGPDSKQSFREMPLGPAAKASNTGLIFVETQSLITGLCGI